ncbi:MAG: YdcF family protein [Gammaproteobacteria bacterium]|nr:YdcF family protein [Gammaproteobacteria bacterium]
MWCYLTGSGLVLASFYLFSIWEVYRFSTQTTQRQADVIIVMGAAVRTGKPSVVLQQRINHAIVLYKANIARKIIFTGGKNQTGEPAESAAARLYALQNGIHAEDIYTESISTSTYENLLQARRIMQQQGFIDALIVSDSLHMKRAMSMAELLEISAFPSPIRASEYQSDLPLLIFLLKEGLKYPVSLIWYRKDVRKNVYK